MSVYRRCPACHKGLTFLDIMKPAFKSTGKSIVCPHCGATISEPWSKYTWLPILGLAVGLLASGWTALILVLIAALFIMYAFVPLKRIK